MATQKMEISIPRGPRKLRGSWAEVMRKQFGRFEPPLGFSFQRGLVPQGVFFVALLFLGASCWCTLMHEELQWPIANVF